MDQTPPSPVGRALVSDAPRVADGISGATRVGADDEPALVGEIDSLTLQQAGQPVTAARAAGGPADDFAFATPAAAPSAPPPRGAGSLAAAGPSAPIGAASTGLPTFSGSSAGRQEQYAGPAPALSAEQMQIAALQAQLESMTRHVESLRAALQGPAPQTQPSPLAQLQLATQRGQTRTPEVARTADGYLGTIGGSPNSLTTAGVPAPSPPAGLTSPAPQELATPTATGSRLGEAPDTVFHTAAPHLPAPTPGSELHWRRLSSAPPYSIGAGTHPPAAWANGDAAAPVREESTGMGAPATSLPPPRMAGLRPEERGWGQPPRSAGLLRGWPQAPASPYSAQSPAFPPPLGSGSRFGLERGLHTGLAYDADRTRPALEGRAPPASSPRQSPHLSGRSTHLATSDASCVQAAMDAAFGPAGNKLFELVNPLVRLPPDLSGPLVLVLPSTDGGVPAWVELVSEELRRGLLQWPATAVVQLVQRLLTSCAGAPQVHALVHRLAATMQHDFAVEQAAGESAALHGLGRFRAAQYAYASAEFLQEIDLWLFEAVNELYGDLLTLGLQGRLRDEAEEDRFWLIAIASIIVLRTGGGFLQPLDPRDASQLRTRHANVQEGALKGRVGAHALRFSVPASVQALVDRVSLEFGERSFEAHSLYATFSYDRKNTVMDNFLRLLSLRNNVQDDGREGQYSELRRFFAAMKKASPDLAEKAVRLFSSMNIVMMEIPLAEAARYFHNHLEQERENRNLIGGPEPHHPAPTSAPRIPAGAVRSIHQLRPPAPAQNYGEYRRGAAPFGQGRGRGSGGPPRPGMPSSTCSSCGLPHGGDTCFLLDARDAVNKLGEDRAQQQPPETERGGRPVKLSLLWKFLCALAVGLRGKGLPVPFDELRQTVLHLRQNVIVPPRYLEFLNLTGERVQDRPLLALPAPSGSGAQAGRVAAVSANARGPYDLDAEFYPSSASSLPTWSDQIGLTSTDGYDTAVTAAGHRPAQSNTAPPVLFLEYSNETSTSSESKSVNAVTRGERAILGTQLPEVPPWRSTPPADRAPRLLDAPHVSDLTQPQSQLPVQGQPAHTPPATVAQNFSPRLEPLDALLGSGLGGAAGTTGSASTEAMPAGFPTLEAGAHAPQTDTSLPFATPRSGFRRWAPVPPAPRLRPVEEPPVEHEPLLAGSSDRFASIPSRLAELIAHNAHLLGDALARSQAAQAAVERAHAAGRTMLSEACPASHRMGVGGNSSTVAALLCELWVGAQPDTTRRQVEEAPALAPAVALVDTGAWPVCCNGKGKKMIEEVFPEAFPAGRTCSIQTASGTVDAQCSLECVFVSLADDQGGYIGLGPLSVVVLPDFKYSFILGMKAIGQRFKVDCTGAPSVRTLSLKSPEGFRAVKLLDEDEAAEGMAATVCPISFGMHQFGNGGEHPNEVICSLVEGLRRFVPEEDLLEGTATRLPVGASATTVAESNTQRSLDMMNWAVWRLGPEWPALGSSIQLAGEDAAGQTRAPDSGAEPISTALLQGGMLETSLVVLASSYLAAREAPQLERDLRRREEAQALGFILLSDARLRSCQAALRVQTRAWLDETDPVAKAARATRRIAAELALRRDVTPRRLSFIPLGAGPFSGFPFPADWALARPPSAAEQQAADSAVVSLFASLWDCRGASPILHRLSDAAGHGSTCTVGAPGELLGLLASVLLGGQGPAVVDLMLRRLGLNLALLLSDRDEHGAHERSGPGEQRQGLLSDAERSVLKEFWYGALGLDRASAPGWWDASELTGRMHVAARCAHLPPARLIGLWRIRSPLEFNSATTRGAMRIDLQPPTIILVTLLGLDGGGCPVRRALDRYTLSESSPFVLEARLLSGNPVPKDRDVPARILIEFGGAGGERSFSYPGPDVGRYCLVDPSSTAEELVRLLAKHGMRGVLWTGPSGALPPAPTAVISLPAGSPVGSAIHVDFHGTVDNVSPDTDPARYSDSRHSCIGEPAVGIFRYIHRLDPNGEANTDDLQADNGVPFSVTIAGPGYATSVISPASAAREGGAGAA